MSGLRYSEEQAEAILREQLQKVDRPSYLAVGDQELVAVPPYEADEGKESALSGKITKYAKDHGWVGVCFRQSRKAEGFLPRGLPDCVWALPEGRTIWLELKSASGTLKQDQKQIALQLIAMGHEWHEVRSFKQFLDIVNKGV